MSAKPLPARTLRFIEEYLVDLNATQAAVRAGYSPKTANEQGARLLANVSVKEAIDEAIAARSARTEITQDMVLQRFWGIATADPRKLIEYRRVCCRHCYGKDHQYQWRDENEFAEAWQSAVREQEACEEPEDAEKVVFPDNKGGYGFNPTLTPHAICPKCFGEGHGTVRAADVRNIDEQTAMLYAGVKETKEGFEIKMHDQIGALESVAKHLGMFINRVEKGAPGEFERLTGEELEKRLQDNERALRAAQTAIGTARNSAREASKN